MRKKFKTKRKIKYKKLFILMIIIILLILVLNYLSNLKILKQDAIKTLEYSNNLKTKRIKISEVTSQIIKIDMNKPTTILKNIMYYEKPNIKEYHKVENNKENNQDPLVYIYNTHQTEEYIESDNTVLTAAKYLKAKLEEINIKTIVEEKNIRETIEENNLNYRESYKASRINLEKTKNQYPNIKIFIDLHRDSVNRELTTVTINNNTYAKVLFVIGKEHDNCLKNLEFTQSLNNIIEQNYPTLTKGILQKEGPGVNGIYNQDLGTNIILMEVGSQDNTIEEVTNTLDIMTDVIKEKINEKET